MADDESVLYVVGVRSEGQPSQRQYFEGVFYLPCHRCKNEVMLSTYSSKHIIDAGGVPLCLECMGELEDIEIGLNPRALIEATTIMRKEKSH